MFTGIVAHKGSVVDIEDGAVVRRLTVEAGSLADLTVGDSIAVNGVCLTAVAVQDSRIDVEVVHETLSRSNLGAVQPGDPVNLERPMSAQGRFDGHIVQGHVDGVGTVSQVVSDGDDRRLTIRVPTGLARFIVEKGSITVDGVSLTVTGVGSDSFEVALIPHTLEVTTLGLRREGDPVNLEVDIIAKYVERLLGAGS
ncbi:MAG TPA: riboflavin synthase [Acidimicrobiia bacterium]|nr:riboflavin synthase [Acidimicrobiia bacterium]